MRLFSIFKQPRNKTYSYTPRYYDERKERIQQLIDKHHGNKEDLSGKRNRINFREEWKYNRQSRSDSDSRIRLFVVAFFLFAAAYLALRYLDIDLL